LRFIFILNNHFIRSTTIGFVLSHWTILGVGIWVEVDRVSLLGILENTEDAPPELAQLANIGYVLIGVGAFLMLMGFLGCCRAVKGSKCMLVSVIFQHHLIIFLVEVAAVIVLFVFKPLVQKVLDEIGEKVSKSIEDNYGMDESYTSVWISTIIPNNSNSCLCFFFFFWLKCCGYNDYTDFMGSQFETTTLLYPVTCCTNSSEPCNKNASENGCFQALVNVIEDNAVLLTGMALGFDALEVFTSFLLST
uniref:Tetraspanin n=1 Tax=Cyprinus carpio TaxID=7962 RepID=A0A8C2KUZ3_CYPCA